VIRELWSFFRRKLRKGNGARWALSYTLWHYRWLRIKSDEAKLMKWLNNE
jgi:hypothetical protein